MAQTADLQATRQTADLQATRRTCLPPGPPPRARKRLTLPRRHGRPFVAVATVEQEAEAEHKATGNATAAAAAYSQGNILGILSNLGINSSSLPNNSSTNVFVKVSTKSS